MKAVRSFLLVSLIAATPTLASAEGVSVEKLADINEIFGNVRGGYDRQDGAYRVVFPNQNTNGEDLTCIVLKDTTVVYNLQQTPQALSQGNTMSCNWAPPARAPQ